MMPLDQQTNCDLAVKQGPSLPVPYTPTTLPLNLRSNRRLMLNAVLATARHDVKQVVSRYVVNVLPRKICSPGKQRRRLLMAQSLRDLKAREKAEKLLEKIKKEKTEKTEKLEEPEDTEGGEGDGRIALNVGKRGKTENVKKTETKKTIEKIEKIEKEEMKKFEKNKKQKKIKTKKQENTKQTEETQGLDDCEAVGQSDTCRVSERDSVFDVAGVLSKNGEVWLDDDGFENVPLRPYGRTDVVDPRHGARPARQDHANGYATTNAARTYKMPEVDTDCLVMMPEPRVVSRRLQPCVEAFEKNVVPTIQLETGDVVACRSGVYRFRDITSSSKAKLRDTVKSLVCRAERALECVSGSKGKNSGHWCEMCCTYVPVGNRRDLDEGQVVSMSPPMTAENLVDLMVSKMPPGVLVSLPCRMCNVVELVTVSRCDQYCLRCHLEMTAKRRGNITFNDLYCGLRARIDESRMASLVNLFYPAEYAEAAQLVQAFGGGLSQTAVALRLVAGIRGTNAKFSWMLDVRIPMPASMAINNGLIPRLRYSNGVEILNRETCWVAVVGTPGDMSITCDFTVPRRQPNSSCLMQVSFPMVDCCRKKPKTTRPAMDGKKSRASDRHVESMSRKIETTQRFLEKRWSWQLLTYLSKHPDMLYLLGLSMEASCVQGARVCSNLGLEVKARVSALQRVCYLVRRDEPTWYDKVFRIVTTLRSISFVLSCRSYPFYCQHSLPVSKLSPAAVVGRIVLHARNGVAFHKNGKHTAEALKESALTIVRKLSKNVRRNAFSVGCYYLTEHFSNGLVQFMSRRCFSLRANRLAHILNGNINAALLPYGPLFLENYVRLMTSIVALISATVQSDVYVTDLAGEFRGAATSSYGMFAYKHALLARELDHADEESDDSEPYVGEVPVYFYDLFRTTECGDDSKYLSASLLPEQFVTDQYGMYYNHSTSSRFLEPARVSSIKFVAHTAFAECLMVLVAKSLISDAMYFSTLTRSRVYMTDEHGFFAGRYPMGSADDARVVYMRDKLYSVRRIDVDLSIPTKLHGIFLASALTDSHHTLASVHGFLASHNIHHDSIGWFYCQIATEENLDEVRKIQDAINDMVERLNLTSPIDTEFEVNHIHPKTTPRPMSVPDADNTAIGSDGNSRGSDSAGSRMSGGDVLDVGVGVKVGVAVGAVGAMLTSRQSSDQMPSVLPTWDEGSGSGPGDAPDDDDNYESSFGILAKTPNASFGIMPMKMPSHWDVGIRGSECDDTSDVFQTFERYKDSLSGFLDLGRSTRNRRDDSELGRIVSFKMSLTSCATDLASIGRTEAAKRISGLLPVYFRSNVFVSNGTHILYNGPDRNLSLVANKPMASGHVPNSKADALQSVMEEHLFKSLLMNIELNTRDTMRKDMLYSGDVINIGMTNFQGVDLPDAVLSVANGKELVECGTRYWIDMYGGNATLIKGILSTPDNSTSRFALLKSMLRDGAEVEELRRLYPSRGTMEEVMVDLGSESPVWMVLNVLSKRFPTFKVFEFKSYKDYVHRLNEEVKKMLLPISVIYKSCFPRHRSVDVVIVACDLESVKEFVAMSGHAIRLAERPSTWHRKSPVLITTDPQIAILGRTAIVQLPTENVHVCVNTRHGKETRVLGHYMDKEAPVDAIRVRAGTSLFTEIWKQRDKLSDRTKDILDMGVV